MALSFPEEMVRSFTRYEINLAYPIEPEAQCFVGLMLDTESDKRIRLGHVAMHAPALAIRAIETHIGQTLPIYDLSDRLRQIDETRVITPNDVFEIKEGPIASSQPRSFLTAIQRAGTPLQDRIVLNPFEYNPRSGNFTVRESEIAFT